MFDKQIDKAMEKAQHMLDARFAQLQNILMQILAELQAINAKIGPKDAT